MDEMTPAINGLPGDISKCDGIEITTNLFKDHKLSIEDKCERLNTYLRIRALNGNESQPNHKINCYQIVDSKTLLVVPPKGSNANKFGSDCDRKKFTFSRIFDEKEDQLSIYENCALPIVKRFLNGENGLLFAYGITSSGKSYTMRGTTTSPGIIPRALRTIFEVIGSKMMKEVPNLKPSRFSEFINLSKSDQEFEDNLRKFIFETIDKGSNCSMNSFRSQMASIRESTSIDRWNDVFHSTFRNDVSNVKCCVWITFYEIYNEFIYDLLDLEIAGERKSNILLLKDEFQNYYIKGLRHVFVSSAEEAYKVLLFGQNNLHISSTDLNKRSSRSHCAFNISLITMNASTTSKKSNISLNNLTFCDLAGAERSAKTNNSGERIKEAGKINGSLLSLSRCLAAIRHNQKFEHDKTKQRFVNFRNSNLTKVLQPYLNGNGIASMISNMNPSPNLFDETLFSLKFTGVASQVVVSTEEQRNRFQDSLKRLTQVWMQSSQRWSNFAHLNPPKPSFSIIQHKTIEEEDDDDESDQNCVDLTYEELEKKVNEISRMDLTHADPQEIEMLRTQIDFLAEKLKQSESDKFDMELQVRQQVVSEFNKLIKDMEEMAEDKDRAKKRLEEMMGERLKALENRLKEEKQKYEKRINDLENEMFRDKEELCKENEKNKKLLEEINTLKSSEESFIVEKHKLLEEIDSLKKILSEKEIQISGLEAQLELQKQTISEVKTKRFDINTSVTDLIHFDTKETSFHIDCEEKAIGTSLIELIDSGTNTEDLNEKLKTSFPISSSDKSTFIENDFLNYYKDKQTITECLSPVPAPIKVDKSIVTNELIKNEMSTSPFNIDKSDKVTSPSIDFEENYISKEELESIKNKYENQLKEKDAMIAYNREIVELRDQEVTKLKEEKEKLIEKMNSCKETNFEPLFKFKSLKPSSITSMASTISSVKSEDTLSVASANSLALKEKQNVKSSKFSSRKKKQNLNSSIEKRYLSVFAESRDDNSESLSQSSVNSDLAESTQDEIGNVAYSTTKKKVDRRANKRRQIDTNGNHEELNKAPESKRKRPPIKNLSISPISPILTEEAAKRMTRSRAKKAIKF